MRRGLSYILSTIAIVSIAILGIGIANYRALRDWGVTPFQDLDLQKLALKLEERGLREEAIRTWQQHVEETSPEARERAAIWYRLGRLAQEAGKYEEALGFLYRAEALGEHLDPEVREEVGRRVTDCLERLGRFGAVAAERTERTSLGGTPEDRGEVIAVIGKEEIRRKDLDEYLEGEAETASAFLPGASPERLAEMREEVYRRLAAPEARIARLEEMVAKKVLLQKGKVMEIDRDEAYQAQIERVRDALLAETLMRQVLAERIHITEGDLRRHYEANLDDYREPDRAEVRHILLEDEAEARALLEEIREGLDFAEAARERSADEETREEGGRIPDPVLQGAGVPGVSRSADLERLIFSTPAGEIAQGVARSEKGHHLVKVESRKEGLPRPFEEVAESVRSSLYRIKQAEVQSEFIRELFREHGVEIYRDRLRGAGREEGGEK